MEFSDQKSEYEKQLKDILNKSTIQCLNTDDGQSLLFLKALIAREQEKFCKKPHHFRKESKLETKPALIMTKPKKTHNTPIFIIPKHLANIEWSKILKTRKRQQDSFSLRQKG